MCSVKQTCWINRCQMNKASLYIHSYTFCCSLTHSTVVQVAHSILSIFNTGWLQNKNDTTLTKCNTGKTQKLSCGFGTTVGLKSIRITPDSTGTILSQNIPHYTPLMSDVIVTFLSWIVVLSQNGQFVDCATVAFCVWYYCQLQE
jgi:hypothetical protein